MKIAAKLFHGVIPTGVSSVYVVPTGRQAIIRSIVVVNTDLSNPQSFNLSVDGVSLIPSKQLAAKETYQLDPFIVLDAGDSVSGNASFLNKVYIFIDGAEY